MTAGAGRALLRVTARMRYPMSSFRPEPHRGGAEKSRIRPRDHGGGGRPRLCSDDGRGRGSRRLAGAGSRARSATGPCSGGDSSVAAGRRPAPGSDHNASRRRPTSPPRTGKTGRGHALRRRRRGQALLRGSGRGRPAGLRPRVRRRPPQLGGAAALLRPALPLRRLQRARLHAVRRARRSRRLRPGPAGRRRRRRARPSRYRQGPCGRACRWAASRPCISAFATRTGRAR